MHKLMLALVTFCAFIPATVRAEGFVLGVVAGALLSGDTYYQSGNATALYVANEETLKSADPMAIRQVAVGDCFYNERYQQYISAHQTLGELFASATKGRKQAERTILQIVRVINPSNVACASIWFTYVER